MEKFSTEIIRMGSIPTYITVYLSVNNDVEDMRKFVESLAAVDHANSTPNRAGKLHLTVYPSKTYNVEEAKEEIDKCLSAYLQNKDVFQSKEILGIEEYLAKYPEVLKQFRSAKEKYNNGIYERNVLDDMRLALELLLKKVLKNDSPLEKQKEALGKYLKEKGSAKETRNMLLQIIETYCYYQNNNIKHMEKIFPNDTMTIIGQTILLMNRIKLEEIE